MPFKVIRVPFMYVSGSHFKISASIKNLGPETIQKGELRIMVSYAFGNFYERMTGFVESIHPQEEVTVDFRGSVKWGVEANGHAIFLALFVDNTGKQIDICDEESRPIQLQFNSMGQPLGYHVHTFHALTVGELYTLMALTVNSVAFITNIILIALVNSAKLSDTWNSLLNYQLTQAILLTLIIAVVLWLVFVYVIYDHYGLYKNDLRLNESG